MENTFFYSAKQPNFLDCTSTTCSFREINISVNANARLHTLNHATATLLQPRMAAGKLAELEKYF